MQVEPVRAEPAQEHREQRARGGAFPLRLLFTTAPPIRPGVLLQRRLQRRHADAGVHGHGPQVVHAARLPPLPVDLGRPGQDVRHTVVGDRGIGRMFGQGAPPRAGPANVRRWGPLLKGAAYILTTIFAAACPVSMVPHGVRNRLERVDRLDLGHDTSALQQLA